MPDKPGAPAGGPGQRAPRARAREMLAQGGKRELRFGQWAARPAVRAAQSTGPLPREQGSYYNCSVRTCWTLTYSLRGLVCCYSAEMGIEGPQQKRQAAHFSDRLGALMALWHRDACRDGERRVDTESRSRHRALCLRPGFLAFVTSLMMATSLWGRNASSLIPPSSCCPETPTVVEKKGGLSCHFARIQSSPDGFQAGHVSPGVA